MSILVSGDLLQEASRRESRQVAAQLSRRLGQQYKSKEDLVQ